MKISGIYKITNLETNECYIGSSKNVKHRFAQHKCLFSWKQHPNNKLYIDFQQYGFDKFSFEILEKTDNLKEREQYWIDLLKPSYNHNRAKGLDIEKHRKTQKKCQKKYRQSDKGKEHQKKCQKKYRQSDKGKEYKKEYNNQLCNYNGEIITIAALSVRFSRAGIEHSTLEAKKYLIN